MACGFQAGYAGSGASMAAKSCRRAGSLPPLVTEFRRGVYRAIVRDRGIPWSSFRWERRK